MDSVGVDIHTDDAMVYIFGFLHPKDLLRVGHVCRRWRRVYSVHGKYFWEQIDAFIGDVDPKESFPYHCIKMVPALGNMHIRLTMKSSSRKCFERLLPVITNHFPDKVRRLQVSADFRLHCHSLCILLRCAHHHMEELNTAYVRGCFVESRRRNLSFGDKTRNFLTLRALHINGNVSRQVHVADVAVLPRLEELLLQDVRGNSLEDLLDNHHLLRVLGESPLRKLTLRVSPSCELAQDCEKFFDYFSRLEHLSLNIYVQEDENEDSHNPDCCLELRPQDKMLFLMIDLVVLISMLFCIFCLIYCLTYQLSNSKDGQPVRSRKLLLLF